MKFKEKSVNPLTLNSCYQNAKQLCYHANTIIISSNEKTSLTISRHAVKMYENKHPKGLIILVT